METNCREQTKYLLERAIRTRGFNITINHDTFTVFHPDGRFGLTLMPGNRRILISHDSYVNYLDRGKGIGKKMLNLREEIAKEVGVNLLLATVRDDNAAENHILLTDGWDRLIKRETGVSLWAKQL